MDIYRPYTYLVGWSIHNKWYYGVRFAKNCHPNDLWVKYFTSSNRVKDLRNQLGEPDIITIRKVFNSAEKARLWESKVIRRVKAVRDPKWLNQSDHNDKFYHEGPRGVFSEEHRNKLSNARKGRSISQEHAEALHEGRRRSKNSSEHIEAIKRHNRGKKPSEETRLKYSLAKKGKPSPNKGKRFGPHSEDYKRKMSETLKEVWRKRKMKDHYNSD